MACGLAVVVGFTIWMEDVGFPARLRAAIGQQGVRAFAKACSLSETAVHKYLAGKSEPTRPVLERMAAAADADLNWLVAGLGPGPRRRDAVSLQDTSGNEFLISASLFGNAPPEKLILHQVGSDEMDPMIAEGDWVLVDRAATLGNGVFLLLMDSGRHVVLRIQTWPGGRWVCRHDNRAYADYDFGAQSVERGYVQVIGRVVWRCGVNLSARWIEKAKPPGEPTSP